MLSTFGASQTFWGVMMVGGGLSCQVTMVMAHRDEASWAKSMWSFDEPADHPQSFGSFLANERPRRWAQGVDLLNRLELVRTTNSTEAIVTGKKKRDEVVKERALRYTVISFFFFAFSSSSFSFSRHLCFGTPNRW